MLSASVLSTSFCSALGRFDMKGGRLWLSMRRLGIQSSSHANAGQCLADLHYFWTVLQNLKEFGAKSCRWGTLPCSGSRKFTPRLRIRTPPSTVQFQYSCVLISNPCLAIRPTGGHALPATHFSFMQRRHSLFPGHGTLLMHVRSLFQNLQLEARTRILGWL